MIDQMPSTLIVEKPWRTFEHYAHNVSSTVKVVGAQGFERFVEREDSWLTT